MEERHCNKCGEDKPASDFYQSNYTECKLCIRTRVDKREKRLRATSPEFVEKERARGREKYKRLGYHFLQTERNKDKFWLKVKYKNQHRDLLIKGIISKGQELHHWNYSLLDEYFILTVSQHRKIHRYLRLDKQAGIFSTMDGILLDTKEKHRVYIEGIISITFPF